MVLWRTIAMSAVIRPMGFEALKQRATQISVCEVIHMESFWQSGRILTWVTLRTSQIYRGGTSKLRVLVPGGTVGEISQHIPGGPVFKLGGESLYFLEPMPTLGGFRLVGFTQGKVDGDGPTAERFAEWSRRLSLTAPQLPSRGDDAAQSGALR